MIRFLRSYTTRILVGVFLVAILYGAAAVWMPYQAELRIARELTSLQGSVYFRPAGPGWMPQSLQERLPFLGRVGGVFLRSSDQVTDSELPRLQSLITDQGLQHLEHLISLQDLSLEGTHITDEGLKSLKDMTGLMDLNLSQTAITDEGLERIKHLSSLVNLNLEHTQTTPAGRDKLRQVLPNCVVTPER